MSHVREAHVALKAMMTMMAFAMVSCARPQTRAPTGGAAMEELYEVRNVTVSIRRAPREVYDYMSDGANIPRWATGLGQEIRRVDDEWIARGTLGTVRVRFAPPNELGVADHDVTLENGSTVHNPLRVVPNGAGSSVIFTLLRRPGVSPDEFERDARTVEKDLTLLKTLLERR
jgi:hypothetical protein